MSEPVIAIENLHKTFKDFWNRPLAEAVKGIDITVGKGEVFGLLGPNGSGKSTTIKMLLGLLSPDSGTIAIFGQSPRSRLVRSRLGYLPELSYLHPFLSARETLEYYAALSGLDRGQTKKRVDDCLAEVGLADVADRRVGGFSKGMARRVALASSLVAEPSLLVMDEPTSGLDPIGTREVKDLIHRLHENGITILMTSHLLADAEDVCTNIAILKTGKVVAAGETQKLLQRDDLVRYTVGGLSPDGAEDLRKKVSEMTGREVSMDHPSVPLEKFFADAIGR